MWKIVKRRLSKPIGRRLSLWLIEYAQKQGEIILVIDNSI